MATFYIDPSVGTTGDGSLATPFRSWSSVTWAAGNTYLQKRNTVHNGSITITADGTLGSEILLGCYFNSDGSDDTNQPLPQVKSTNSSTYSIVMSGRAYIKINKIHCVSSVPVSYSGGIYALNTSNLTIDSCITAEEADYGIRVDNTGSTTLSNITLNNNTVLGTSYNSGILVIWGSALGGIFSNVIIKNNLVANTGISATSGNFPGGIRLLSRAAALTSTSGTVDLDYFSKGIQVTNNTLNNIKGYGLVYSAITNGTISNIIQGNRLYSIGDGQRDAHALWLGCCRSVLVDRNYVTNTIAWVGQNQGSGVGIFIDQAGDSREFDISKNIIVSNNIISNTGLGSSLNSEVGGGGVTCFLSSQVQIYNNLVKNCSNGIVVIGWYGVGLKSSNVEVYNNTVVDSKNTNYYVCKAADVVTLKNNLSLRGNIGYYLENSGGGTVTNYTETYNSSFAASTQFAGGNEPTTLPSTIISRTPDASNLISNPQVTDTYMLKSNSPLLYAGVTLPKGNKHLPPSIGAYEYVTERADAGTRGVR